MSGSAQVGRLERREMALVTPLPVRGSQSGEPGAGRVDDPALTWRQREVVDGLVRGLTNKEIAAELGVGPDAVKRTISRLLVKLNAPSRTALVEIAMRSSAARLRRSRAPKALTLLDAAPIPVLVTRGREHYVDHVNPAAAAVLGTSAVGTALSEMFPASARDSVRAVADAAFAANTERVATSVVLSASTDADPRWRRADVYASPVRDGAEQLAGLIVFLLDTSERDAPC